MSLIGGFSLYTIALILYSGVSILYTLAQFAFAVVTSPSTPAIGILQSQIPGVAPLIPGVTIPLFAGIIALAILLVVHEFSHGILASLAKVRIKEIGVILFGIIPMGAFVEPDERQIRKLSVQKQDRVFIAGISANMLTCLFFFVLTFAMLYYVIPNIGTGGVLVTLVAPNYPANGVIAVNSTILKWNNVTIRNSFDLATVEAAYLPANKVVLTTSLGAFTVTPTSSGKLGIDTAPAVLSSYYQLMEFIYAVVALSFGLNFFVAIFNLLPIPGFDGWRIYQNKIKSKKLLNALALVIIAAILLNVVPWIWSVS
jgi:membrane-associated protease RseP (regulator of RpoE activity)